MHHLCDLAFFPTSEFQELFMHLPKGATDELEKNDERRQVVAFLFDHPCHFCQGCYLCRSIYRIHFLCSELHRPSHRRWKL